LLLYASSCPDPSFPDLFNVAGPEERGGYFDSLLEGSLFVFVKMLCAGYELQSIHLKNTLWGLLLKSAVLYNSILLYLIRLQMCFRLKSMYCTLLAS
jgi:hypothetical protein